jgi:hypothetical protein
MEIWKHELVGINLTKKEVEDIVMNHILSKHPELANEKVWSWEDFNLNHDYKMKDDAISCEAHFSKIDSSYPQTPEPKQLDIFDTMKCSSGCSCSNSDICR